MSKSVLEPLLTIPDVAGICRVCTKTVRRWIRDKRLPATRLGNQWRIRPNDLKAFIDDAKP
jgi:excisionase family DNA binding protein